ncbi:MAG: hypothetical protein HC923_11815 [Myxococcales bacterium]|nr:hypothetical protein [Myxococcales bacterium]
MTNAPGSSARRRGSSGGRSKIPAPIGASRGFRNTSARGGWTEGTRHLRHTIGLEHVRPYATSPILLVANHRSFFDMFVLNAILFREAGFRQRFLFPVRSSFFYDHPGGFFVNMAMSFWSMYPPIHRDPKHAHLNHRAFEELARQVRAGRSAGIHPEGTRGRVRIPTSSSRRRTEWVASCTRAASPSSPRSSMGYRISSYGNCKSTFGKPVSPSSPCSGQRSTLAVS